MWSISATATHKAFLIAVKKKRKEIKLPQKVIAHELGLTPAGYSLLEAGQVELSLHRFIFLCKRLNLKPETFLN
jgi:transcriptional regulator with XRE-family HTH domain